MEEISRDEWKVLEVMRSRKFQNITIQINDGKVVVIRREETIKPEFINDGKQSPHR